MFIGCQVSKFPQRFRFCFHCHCNFVNEDTSLTFLLISSATVSLRCMSILQLPSKIAKRHAFSVYNTHLTQTKESIRALFSYESMDSNMSS